MADPENTTLDDLKARLRAIQMQLGTVMFDLEARKLLPLSAAMNSRFYAVGLIDESIKNCERAAKAIDRMQGNI